MTNFPEEGRQEMMEMEKKMPIWKIVAYRSFAINVTRMRIERKKAEEAISASSEKGAANEEKENFNGMINMINSFWVKNWFRT
jgi:hypothetical protein